MRSLKLNLARFICIAIGLAMIIGCGTQDLLDENGLRYQSFISLIDNDEETLTIDTTQDGDCNDDLIFDDPEPFTDVLVQLEIDVAEQAPGIRLTGYAIEYLPLQSIDELGVLRMPPTLPALTDLGSFSFEVPTNSSATFTTTGMTVDAKEAYVDALRSDVNLNDLDNSRYTFRITYYYEDEFGENRTIVESRTVELGFYDNC